MTPKVGVVRVLSLLARAHGLKVDEDLVAVSPEADLSAVLAVLFVQEAAGPMRGYRTKDQALPVLGGGLRLREQHLRRSASPSRWRSPWTSGRSTPTTTACCKPRRRR